MISNYKFTENAFLPKTVTIPLVQDKDSICNPVIKPGEVVREGQLIAKSELSEIHSPVPGTVTDIHPVRCPNGKIEKAIIIKTQGSFDYLGKKLNEEKWESLSPASIEQKLSEKGILNTFSCTKPEALTDQIKKILRNRTRTIVVRLFDEDTLRISDSLMTKFYFDKIKTGAAILAKTIDADGILYVLSAKDLKEMELENNEKQGIYYLGTKIKKYTTGFKREIISLFDKTLKKSCKLSISRKDIFIDSYTLIDIYNAVVYGLPVLTRTINIAGNCLSASCFLNVRLGFTLKELIIQLGGFIKPPKTIIINGRICGNAVTSLDIPITKYVKSVEFLSKSYMTDSQVYSCVKCGLCRNKCPVRLAPDILYEYVLKKTDIPQAFLNTATMCINCGICNTYCQSRIPLCQTITMIKYKTEQNNGK